MKIGDIFQVHATATGTGALTYVWHWWDGTTTVTTTSTTSKLVNRAGNLDYSVVVVDALGNSSSFPGLLVVETPPSFSNVRLTANDQPAPYACRLTARVSDPRNDYPVTCRFNGSTATFVASGTATFDFNVTHAARYTLSGTNNAMTATTLPIDMRTGFNQKPVVTLPKVLRSKLGGLCDVLVVARDPDGTPLIFEWILRTSNGWAADRTVFGVTTPFGSGYQNVSNITLDGESAGPKTIVLRVTDEGLDTVEVQVHVSLQANGVPHLAALSQPASGVAPVGAVLTFTGSAVDPDGDTLSYAWSLNGPVLDGHFEWNSYVTAVEVVAAGLLTGSLTVTDGAGGSVSQAITPIVVYEPL